ncbi:MAG TPA: hypothetical protein VN605_06010, partial [Thermoanaerobaculia bacterium]|nr:hypothetical protein [Thermoanaerobaculia bacterium]
MERNAFVTAAVVAFAHRAIEERDTEALARAAVAQVAAILPADETELLTIDRLSRRFRLAASVPPRAGDDDTFPIDDDSLAAEAYESRGVVARALEVPGDRRHVERGLRFGVAGITATSESVCVLSAFARERPFGAEESAALEMIGVLYGAAAARCETEERLADRERRLRLILEQLPAIVSTLDRELVFTSIQGAGLAELPADAPLRVGLTLAEVVGSSTGPAHAAM